MKIEEVKCQKCGNGVVLRHNRKNLNSFYGCSIYPKCKRTMTVKEYNKQVCDIIGDYPDIDEELDYLDHDIFGW